MENKFSKVGRVSFAGKFGMSPVAAGQKGSSVCVDPLLIVASTPGKFTITPAVSRVLALAPGDYITFGDNADEIRKAIALKDEEIVALFEENEADIDNPADVDAMIDAMRSFFIYKSIPEFNADGTPKMCTARTTIEEKKAYAAEHRDEIVAALEAAGIEATEENILAQVKGDEVQSYNGSKCATTSKMNGIGLNLNFTDSNMWTVMKSDIDAETRKSIKRTFKVDVKNPLKAVINDGCKDVEITYYALTRDEATSDVVVTRGSSDEEAGDEAAE